MRSTADVGANLDQLEALVVRAARAGASLVVTPENTPFLGPPAERLRIAEPVDGPLGTRFAALARSLGVHLLIGSMAERCDATRTWNTSVLYGPDGAVLGTYRKLHLFDIDLPGGPQLQESASVAPGTAVVVVPTALGNIGMSVCYDLRFPELYRALVDAGATVLSIPSAFTLATGKDHWHVLTRARAIECQAFVIAAAQEGPHDAAGLRHSYGHALVADPWGVVLAECGEGPGIALAEVDSGRVQRVRAAMPVAGHRRLKSPG